MNWKLVALVLVILAILSGVVIALVLWVGKQPLNFGLVYHHPVGNWTHVCKIHWLGSPLQFGQVNNTGALESDIAKISNAGYKSILFHTCIACLNRTAPPYNASNSPYPTDFDYSFLKQNVKWITDRAKYYGLEVYVLYYPDWRSEDYGKLNIGYYYNESSENWHLMIDFTYFLVQECNGVRWAAPFSLTRNATKVQYFFDNIGIPSPKILMHADEPFIEALMSLKYPKLIEVYDVEKIPMVKDINAHVITGQKRLNGSLTQRQQVTLIKDKINMLGKQKNIMIWCYADYPDSSAPEDLGLVQTPDETLPPAETWKHICQVSIISDIASVHDCDTPRGHSVQKKPYHS